MNLFQIFYQPLLNALVLIYHYLPGHSFGLAIIALTVLIRLLLYPLVSESIRFQRITADLQPKLKEIKKIHKDDKEKQALLTMDLFKKHKVNPFGGIVLPLLIQLPILIGLYQVFYYGITSKTLASLYSFVPDPGVIDPNFFGLVNLAQGSVFMAGFAAILQYFQTKMVTNLAVKDRGKNKEIDPMEEMQKYTLYVFPLITVFIFYKLPSALSLYWITSSIFSIVQQYIVLSKTRPVGAVALESPSVAGRD